MTGGGGGFMSECVFKEISMHCLTFLKKIIPEKLSTMDGGLTVFILLSLGVAAQAQTKTVYFHDVYSEVSVPMSQLETTQIVSQPISLSSNISVFITAQKNVTRCTELNIDPCPEPKLLASVSRRTLWDNGTDAASNTSPQLIVQGPLISQ
ncbi:uncharacterized protein [Pyxicephalus adspersus]|uniref:uncharacterized protein isoform X2 n=1 Tax=Pyxicephalus adspersus TaxID=30357 RepID=UPI003B5C4B15